MDGRDAPYLVMSIDGDSAIVLSGDGAFERVSLARLPADSRCVGATTHLLPEESAAGGRLPAATRRHLPEWARWLASAAVVVLALWAGSSAYEAYAYPYHIAVDINPSIVLVFDRDAKLYDLRPRNSEAANLVSDLSIDDLRGTTPSEAVRALVAAAHAKGYLELTVQGDRAEELDEALDDTLTNGTTIELNADAANLVLIGIHRQWRTEIPETLSPASLGQHVREMATEMRVDTAIVAQTVDGSEWRSAQRQNVSPIGLALGWQEDPPAPGPERAERLRQLRESEAFTGPRRGVVLRSELPAPGQRGDSPPGQQNGGAGGQNGPGPR